MIWSSTAQFFSSQLRGGDKEGKGNERGDSPLWEIW